MVIQNSKKTNNLQIPHHSLRHLKLVQVKNIVGKFFSSIRLKKHYQLNKTLIGKLAVKRGRKQKYFSEEERKKAHRDQSLKSYHKRTEKYKRDIDKSISWTSKKKYERELVEMLNKNGFSHLITLTNNDSFNYISQRANTTKQQLENYTKNYLSKLTKNGKMVYDNYLITYEKNDAQKWHAHIVINVIDPTINNVHNFLMQRWNRGISNVKKIKVGQQHAVLTYVCKQIGPEKSTSSIENWSFKIAS